MRVHGVLIDVQPEAEETVEHRAYNTTYLRKVTALRQMKLTRGLV